MNTLFRKQLFADKALLKAYDAAIGWIKEYTLPEAGISATSSQKVVYAEVTGYLIPTLLDCGEIKLARQYADYLLFVQRPNGSFCGTDGREYVFDTGQILKGLVRITQLDSRYESAARKAADYVVSCIQADGSLRSIYDGDVHGQVHVYVLPGLKDAAEQFHHQGYFEALDRAKRFYTTSPDALKSNDLAHFYAYALEGLLDLGEKELALGHVKEIFKRQRGDGSITAYPGKSWVCSVAMAQLAVVAYKSGMIKEGDLALDYLIGKQNPSSGGFWGSYGFGAKYFPHEEISWAVKFLLDAIHMKVRAFFDQHADVFHKDISMDDPRVGFILEQLSQVNGGRVLDAGCAKGRFAQRIHDHRPNLEIHGLDLSPKLLAEAPAFMNKKLGSLLCLPYPDEFFDAVVCVEVLEHTMHYSKAISEMCRVLKDGGVLIVIDKNLERLGDIQITDFEQWFDAEDVEKLIGRHCANVRSRSLALKKHAEDLFLGWAGTKGSVILDEGQWHDAIRAGQTVEELVKKIRSNDFPLWAKPLLEVTAPGEEILELGCGTAELSGICGVYGRKMHLLDFSEDSLVYGRELFKALELDAQFHQADILKGLPLTDGAVDWVFSSGVLEHFTDPQIIDVLKDCKRVARKGVISLVPNASAVFYRIGKLAMEDNGTWEYGRETPKKTMKPLFEAAGLGQIKEFSVGTYHTLNFWGEQHPEIKKFLDHLSSEELQSMNMGYLLFTVGTRA